MVCFTLIYHNILIYDILQRYIGILYRSMAEIDGWMRGWLTWVMASGSARIFIIISYIKGCLQHRTHPHQDYAIMCSSALSCFTIITLIEVVNREHIYFIRLSCDFDDEKDDDSDDDGDDFVSGLFFKCALTIPTLSSPHTRCQSTTPNFIPSTQH